MKTQDTFKGLTGKQLLDMIPADKLGYTEIDGINFALTPRRFEFNNRVVICSNDEAQVVGVQSRFMKKEILVRIS